MHYVYGDLSFCVCFHNTTIRLRGCPYCVQIQTIFFPMKDSHDTILRNSLKYTRIINCLWHKIPNLNPRFSCAHIHRKLPIQ